MADYPEAKAAIDEWETKTFFQSVSPAKLATVVQELMEALTTATKRIDGLEQELAILRRQAGLCARHQDERRSAEQAITTWRSEQQERIDAERSLYTSGVECNT